MCNSRTPHALRIRSAAFQSTLSQINTTKAPPPFNGAEHELFYGQSLWPVASASLHNTPGLHSVSPPSVTFRSLSASSLGTHARVLPFIPFRSGQPAVSFCSPLAFLPTIQNSKPKWEAPFHPPQFTTLHSVTTLAFPYLGIRMPCGRVCPGRQKPQIPHCPLMVPHKNHRSPIIVALISLY